MKSGRLSTAIQIQRATVTLSEAGTPAETWAKIADLRAEKVEQSTTEFMRGFGASDESVVIFRARFFAGVTNADRVLWGGQAYNIKEVSPIGRRKGVELRCVRFDP